MLASLTPTDTNKTITVENNIYRKKCVKKIKNFAKKEECLTKFKNQKNKKQLRPLSEGWNQILILESDPEDTKRCYSGILDVRNTRPTLLTKMDGNKKSVFRSRSNACVSQNIKEIKSAGI